MILNRVRIKVMPVCRTMRGWFCTEGSRGHVTPKACIEAIKRAVVNGRLSQVLLEHGEGRKTYADELCEGALKGRDIDIWGVSSRGLSG